MSRLRRPELRIRHCRLQQSSPGPVSPGYFIFINCKVAVRG